MNGTAEILIERTGLEGQGVGTDPAGNIYFVPGTVPGDRVRVSYDLDQKRYRDANLEAILEKSQDRIEPACTHFPECGGCDWLHWSYPAQIKAKESILKHVLQRGGIEPDSQLPMLGARQIFGYRNRIQLRRQSDELGFYRKRSHQLVNIGQCRVADDRLNQAIERLRLEPAGENQQKIEIYVDSDGEVHTSYNRPHAAGGFNQVHAEQNEVLRKWVRDTLRENRAKKVLEVFCGNGNLSFAYADVVEELIGVDSDPSSIESARAQRGESKLKAAFFAERVDRRLRRKLPPDFQNSYDTLVVDPPRQGVEEGLGSLLHEKLRNIVYVSCSPVSFSRDAQCLKKNFRLRRLQPIDMFPHTRHIELVAFFERS